MLLRRGTPSVFGFPGSVAATFSVLTRQALSLSLCVVHFPPVSLSSFPSVAPFSRCPGSRCPLALPLLEVYVFVKNVGRSLSPSPLPPPCCVLSSVPLCFFFAARWLVRSRLSQMHDLVVFCPLLLCVSCMILCFPASPQLHRG